MEREEVLEAILHKLEGYNTTGEILTEYTLITAFGNQGSLEYFLNSLSNLPTKVRKLNYNQKPSCFEEDGEIKKTRKSGPYKKEMKPFLEELADLSFMNIYNVPLVLLDTTANYCLANIPYEFRGQN